MAVFQARHACLLSVIVVGCSTISVSGTPIPISDYNAVGMTWVECPAETPSTLRCATLDVPMDWQNLDGPTITLAMNVLPARNQSKRIGYLMVNPGGPGGSGRELNILAELGEWYWSDDLRDHFDILGADPRGIGASNAVACDAELWNTRTTVFPTDQESYDALVDHWTAFGASCANMTGPLLSHVDTVNAAQDIEAIRLALGDEKLNWLGFSYGTQLGSTYADLYPSKIRAMILDGNLDHWQTEVSMLSAESRAYEMTLNAFFDWCDSDSTCAARGLDSATSQTFDRLVSEAYRKPITAQECATSGLCRADVNGEEILFNAQEFMMFPVTGFPSLGLALAQATAGNATLLSTPLAQSNTDGFGGQAVQCLDWFPHTTTADIVLNKKQMTDLLAPHTRGACQSWNVQITCLGWPVDPNNPPHKFKILTAPPMLLVNSYSDPATAYEWAVGLQSQIGGSVLLTRNGTGHTSYEGASDAAAIMDRYLITLELPPAHMIVDS